MLSSMTGYGKAVTTIQGVHFEVEMKSLNSRFLEMSLRLPGGLASKEFELRELLKKYFNRGKIFCSIGTEGGQFAESGFVYNKPKIESVMELLRRTKADFRIKDKIRLRHILTFRDLYASDTPALSDEEFSILRAAIESAARQLIEMRRSEGAELRKDITGRLSNIEELLGGIESKLDAELREYHDRFRQRVSELVRDVTPNNERLEYEIGLLTEKSDITEECVRLRSHIKFFAEAMRGSEAGRKLNFICQEFHREVNTITSKTISTEITRAAIAMKEEIERIREQVQNIE